MTQRRHNRGRHSVEPIDDEVDSKEVEVAEKDLDQRRDPVAPDQQIVIFDDEVWFDLFLGSY